MISAAEKDWVKTWAPRICGALYLLLVLSFLAGHPQPGSIDSLVYGLLHGILPAVGSTALVLAISLAYRRARPPK